MKKVILFGAGNYYQKYKKYIEDKIVAICDNSIQKQGRVIDGHLVISPDEIMDYNPDSIIILSLFVNEIREQLLGLGIPLSRIRAFYEINCSKKIDEYRYYNTDSVMTNEKKDSILVITHELSFSGAPIALLDAVKQLKILGYYVTVASPDDGDMREKFLLSCDQIIIDEKLRYSKLSELDWANEYKLIFVNTIRLFYLLRDLNLLKRVIWWLHEPECYYMSVDSRCLCELDYSRISVCAVSEVARVAFLKCCRIPHCLILPYGKGDSPRKKRVINYMKLNCVVIGSISKLKGHNYVVEAIQRIIRNGYTNVSVCFIGDDTTLFAQQLKEKVSADNLPIFFAGKLDNHETLSIIEDSNLLICSSEVECLSVSITEGMMKGVACLIPNTAGNCSYVTDKWDGVIFKACDADDLFHKVVWCINNIDRLEMIGKNGRRLFDYYFSIERFRLALSEVLSNMK